MDGFDKSQTDELSDVVRQLRDITGGRSLTVESDRLIALASDLRKESPDLANDVLDKAFQLMILVDELKELV